MINFCSFEEERLHLVEKALSWFNESDTRVVTFLVGKDTQKTPRSIKIFCHFLSDLIDSLPVTNDEPIIIIPDCSSTSFKHLVDLLTTGYSEEASSDMESVVEVMESVVAVAKVLKIDIDNLVADIHCTEDDLKDGKIGDSDESLSKDLQTEKVKTFSSLKVAAFSKSFISVPNLISNNNEESSTIGNKSFSIVGNSNKELPPISTDNKTFSTVGISNNSFSTICDNDKLFSTVDNSNMELPTIRINENCLSSTAGSMVDKGLPLINNKLFSTSCNKKSPKISKYEKDSWFQCQVCDRTFSTCSGLKTHMSNTTKHTLVTNYPTQFKSNPTLNPVKVKRVGKPIISIQARHGEEDNMVMFKCNLCEFPNFKRQCDLNNHKEATHNWCSSCFSSFKSKQTLKNHRQRCRLALYNLMLSSQK